MSVPDLFIGRLPRLLKMFTAAARSPATRERPGKCKVELIPSPSVTRIECVDLALPKVQDGG